MPAALPSPASAPSGSVLLNRFTRLATAPGIMRGRMDPCRVPLDPGGELPAPAPARRPPAPRLQPLLGLAPANARPVQPDRPDGLDPLPQPDPGDQRADRLVARCSTTRSSWPSTTTSWPSSTATWPTAPTTGSSAATPIALDGPIAYFCAEYGFHESLGIYSGGLGVLAGDHMKTASDMALPVIGVGLLYRKGYFRQTIDADGHQEHDYPDYDLTRLPLGRVQDPSGAAADGDDRAARARPVDRGLGRPGRPRAGPPARHGPAGERRADRPITNILYVRGREMRLHQELVLGIGGVRAIRALGSRRRSGI